MGEWSCQNLPTICLKWGHFICKFYLYFKKGQRIIIPAAKSISTCLVPDTVLNDFEVITH